MKSIKNKVLALCLLLPGCVIAQENVPFAGKGKIQVLSQRAEELEDSLCLNIRFNLQELSLGSCQTLLVYPVIEGEKRIDCPPLVVSGRMNHIDRKRTALLNPKALEAPNAQQSILYRKGEMGEYHYIYAIPYEYPWMDNAKVHLMEFIIDCAGDVENRMNNYLCDIIVGERLPAHRYAVKPKVSFLTPKAEAVKDRQEKGEAFLDFQVGKSKILPDYKNNPVELRKMREAISSIKDNANVILKGIEIRGFASIDGSTASNMRLSLARAAGLKEYFQKMYNFNNTILKVSAQGEDWEGLARLVSESTMTDIDKEELLKLINGNETEDRKEQMLKAYKGGRLYKRMADELFPLLRRVQYTVNYSVKTFTLEEGQKMILTRPALLSLNEMFLVANSYEKGSEDFNNVFDIAVRMYPEDVTARVNAAAIALQKNDIISAHKYLKELSGADVYNNLGVSYLLEGDLEKAEDALLKAKAEGAEFAEYNLEELARKKADNELFERLSHRKR